MSAPRQLPGPPPPDASLGVGCPRVAHGSLDAVARWSDSDVRDVDAGRGA